MKKLILVLTTGVLSLSSFAQGPCKEVIGYYPDWQWYDRSQLVNPMTIDYSKYTIINYCFFQPMPNGTIALGDSWAEQNLLQGQFNWSTNQYIPNTSIVDRAHNANTKVLVSIGGWTWSNNFPAIAADPVKRAAFAHDCNYYVNFYNLDGIDIDWEYPGYAPHGGGPADAGNFTLLMRQIRDSLDALELQHNEQYLLTAAVGASQAHMSNVQWNNIVPLLDMINLMSYDFFGAWDANANHNSPLYAPACGDPSFNIDSAFRALTTVYGVPANKINIGVAFYGRTQSGYTSLCGPTNGQAAVNAFPPDGVPLYYDIHNNMSSYTRNWDSNAEVPYLTGNGIFVSYDDEESIGKKADYINANGACGAIIWEITGDYIETAPGSGVIAGTPLADTLNAVFCQNPTLSTNDPLPQHSIEVFPVPASDQLNISGLTSTSGNVMIRILDLSGRTVMEESRTVNNGNSQLNISDLSTGTYFLQVIAEGNSIAKKFTIQK
jgi:chitinase